MPFAVRLYESPDGTRIVEKRLLTIQEREPQAWTSISIGLRLLSEVGADPDLSKFKRLRYVAAGSALWELRAQGRPAYRLLFMLAPGSNEYVVLEVVRKDDMARDSRRPIEVALARFQEWTRRIP